MGIEQVYEHSFRLHWYNSLIHRKNKLQFLVSETKFSGSGMSSQCPRSLKAALVIFETCLSKIKGSSCGSKRGKSIWRGVPVASPQPVADPAPAARCEALAETVAACRTSVVAEKQF